MVITRGGSTHYYLPEGGQSVVKLKMVPKTTQTPMTILLLTAGVCLLWFIMPLMASGQISCPAPLTLCGSTCTNVLTDPKNCGVCGNVCSLPNGTSYCSSGLCWVESCNFGWGDCDGVFWNGCETNLLTNVKNCGAYAVACQGGTTCYSGQCK